MHVTVEQIAPACLLLFVGYLYCCIKLYYIIKSEHPEWLAYKPGRNMLYISFPKVLDPMIIESVIAIACSAKASQLSAPKAFFYCMTLRIIIVTGMLLFFWVIFFISAY